MKQIIKIVLILLYFTNITAREIGETEITTEDGIEVYQNEKFYLLKKNVNIVSDSFTLRADKVKINYEENLYDITKLYAEGNVDFNSQEFEMKGSSEFLELAVKIEELKLKGKGSQLVSKDVKMFSDGFIEVNNINGNFFLNGLNSKLVNDEIIIQAKQINGVFSDNGNKKNINSLNVYDEKISYVKNIDTEMYAKKINFNYENSIIELIDDVTIIRNEEKISGDYGTLDTTNNSYKIKSNNRNKVKVIIQNNE